MKTGVEGLGRSSLSTPQPRTLDDGPLIFRRAVFYVYGGVEDGGWWHNSYSSPTGLIVEIS